MGAGDRTGDETLLMLRKREAPRCHDRALAAHENGMPIMKQRLLALAVSVALGLAPPAGPAAGEDQAGDGCAWIPLFRGRVRS